MWHGDMPHVAVVSPCDAHIDTRAHNPAAFCPHCGRSPAPIRPYTLGLDHENACLQLKEAWPGTNWREEKKQVKWLSRE